PGCVERKRTQPFQTQPFLHSVFSAVPLPLIFFASLRLCVSKVLTFSSPTHRSRRSRPPILAAAEPANQLTSQPTRVRRGDKDARSESSTPDTAARRQSRAPACAAVLPGPATSVRARVRQARHRALRHRRSGPRPARRRAATVPAATTASPSTRQGRKFAAR